MITAIVLYDLPPSIGLEECRAHFTKIAPDFLKAKGFLRKQFICRKEGGIAGGVYMWESQADAEAFYSGPWREGIRARYGNDPKIQYFETVALTDKATGKAGAISSAMNHHRALACCLRMIFSENRYTLFRIMR